MMMSQQSTAPFRNMTNAAVLSGKSQPPSPLEPDLPITHSNGTTAMISIPPSHHGSTELSADFAPAALLASQTSSVQCSDAQYTTDDFEGDIPRSPVGSLPEYGKEILEHFLMRERTMPRNAAYLHNQPEVTERMRSILLDWMVDVHIKFKLHPETYFLAVDIIDRYLSMSQTTRSRLQLVGVTATLLAAKHEEIWPPEVKDCVYIAANTYGRDDILACEREISNHLQFRLAVPTGYPIMSYILDAMEAAPKLKFTAVMFLESSAVDYTSLRFLPSMNAFAAVVLAKLTLLTDANVEWITPEQIWPSSFEYTTRTDYATIVPCAEQMLAAATQIYSATSRYKASCRKYSSSKFLDVATQKFPATLPHPL